jgi:tetratricopeptide (TPR) repeat protein
MQLVLALLIAASALPSPGTPGSHEPWLREIRSAGARKFRAALSAFDAHLRTHPADAVAAVERCKVIGGTENEEEQRLDPEAPTYADCLKDLERAFPESAAVVTYLMNFKWNADGVAFGRKALANARIAFSDAERGQVYERLSQAEKSLGHTDAAAQLARTAMSLDPSVDLTELLGQILLEQGRKSEAIVVLSSRPEGAPYQLQQKAKHLADAGAFFRAQWMMDKAMAQKGFVPDSTLQGRIAEGTGNVQQAREAYQKGRAAWSDADILPRLFRLALAGGDAGAANRAYQEIRDRGFNADPLARRRLALQLKFPRTSWRARDFAGIAALLGALLGLSLLPLVALLPLHTFVLWRRLQRSVPEPAEEPGAWWFRHFCLAGALMLAAQFLALYVFAYDELAKRCHWPN